MGLREAEDWI